MAASVLHELVDAKDDRVSADADASDARIVYVDSSAWYVQAASPFLVTAVGRRRPHNKDRAAAGRPRTATAGPGRSTDPGPPEVVDEKRRSVADSNESVGSRL